MGLTSSGGVTANRKLQARASARPALSGRVIALRLNDDEIATAALLEATAAWVRGAGPAPYPLARRTT